MAGALSPGVTRTSVPGSPSTLVLVPVLDAVAIADGPWLTWWNATNPFVDILRRKLPSGMMDRIPGASRGIGEGRSEHRQGRSMQDDLFRDLEAGVCKADAILR